MRAGWRDERGQAVPLAAARVGLAVVVTLGLGELAAVVAHAGRARTAADAAALAGVGGGRSAAARLADANGGVLVAWAQDGDTVTVTGRVGDAVATARATR